MFKDSWNKQNKALQFAAALLAAYLGGLLFSVLHWPIPWLLGPMTAILILSRLKIISFYWPVNIRNAGLIIVGYSMGLSFTKSTLLVIFAKLPSIVLMTVLLLLISTGMAFVISRISGIDFPTALTSSIPGGLSQLITFAEESKGIDITTVTFFQVSRIIMIIFMVPLLIFSPLFAGNGAHHLTQKVTTQVNEWPHFSVTFLLFILFSVVMGILGKRFRLPTAYLLGPIIGIAVLNVAGINGPPAPHLVLNLSQFMIGGYIGLLLKPELLKNKGRVIPLAIFSGLGLIIISLGLTILLMYQFNLSAVTSFLSMAPGGADQMGIIGQEVHANLSLISGYQLFRILFIFFAVPSILRWVLMINNKQRTKQH